MKHTDQKAANIPDTLLIFVHPDDYFFPALKHTVYPTFCIPRLSLRYVLYKLLYCLHLPGTRLFWGSWTKYVPQAKQIIIFDYGYQRGMERYIHRVNPDCKVALFIWNMISPQHNGYQQFSDPDAIYSTDPADCARFHFHYNSIFYTKQYRKDWQDKNHHLFFIGHDKGRAPYLLKTKELLEHCGITCDIRLVSDSRQPAYIRSLGTLYAPCGLSYPQYLSTLDDCDILLDVTQHGQQALTMRVMEAIFLSKKLITNNATIQNFDFYNENNIFILPEDLSTLSEPALRSFLEKPFLPYPEEILDYYDFDAWKKRFFADDHC